jgi:hypothetical protein
MGFGFVPKTDTGDALNHNDNHAQLNAIRNDYRGGLKLPLQMSKN